jgi:hypothetical protein
MTPIIPDPPAGPSRGKVGETLLFSAYSRDLDGDELSYKFDWGDGKTSSWSIFIPNRDAIHLSHSYCLADTYYIKVRVRDVHNDSSDWSPSTSAYIYPDTLSNSIRFYVDGTSVATLSFSPDSLTTQYPLCIRGKSEGGNLNGLADNAKLNFWGYDCSNPVYETFEGDLSSWNTFGTRPPRIIGGGHPGNCLKTNGNLSEESGIFSNEIFEWGNTDWTIEFDGKVFTYSYGAYVECGIIKGESLIIGLRYGTGKVEMWTDLSSRSINITMGEHPGIWRSFRIERE